MEQFESFLGINFWTALLTLGNFLLVLFVGKKFLYGPILNMIESRQKEIDDLYADAGSAKEQANALHQQYQQKLSAAQAESQQIVADAVKRAQSREEEILRKANDEASGILAKASADIAQEKKKALNDAKNEIAGLSLAIAEKVVERELNQADQADLIDRFIGGLGDQA